MSPHPFFVDQTPYLPVASSSSSSLKSTIGNKSSIYSLSDSSASSSSSTLNLTHSRTQSSVSLNTLSSEKSISSISSTSSTSTFSRSTPPIDRECLRWMQTESDCEHIFGSVSSRGKSLSIEARDVRRRQMELEEQQNKFMIQSQENDPSNTKAIKAERRKGKIGKWF
ncbi:uncharacterized protein L201_002215 [Kwoniella dendrophila CBS 6074]|uniref:Uncharacterized protein n=1 Tax=Kwoniella dendrophila CBS 6074 TaxID=1295534 RepID=A0AAX4JPK8_9TREE